MTSESRTSSPSRPEVDRGRRFGIFDLMVVIAALAVMLVFAPRPFTNLLGQLTLLGRTIAEYFGWGTRPIPAAILRRQISNAWAGVTWYAFQSAELCILVATPSLLLMRPRRPRPPARIMLRQPGVVACLSVIFGTIWVAGWLHRLYFGRVNSGTVNAIASGCTVAASWIVLALGRNWDREPDVIERAGRRLGASAILVALFAFVEFGL